MLKFGMSFTVGNSRGPKNAPPGDPCAGFVPRKFSKRNPRLRVSRFLSDQESCA